jgi:hypothetical protein
MEVDHRIKTHLLTSNSQMQKKAEDIGAWKNNPVQLPKDRIPALQNCDIIIEKMKEQQEAQHLSVD